MADSCADLAAKLAALQAEVARLKKIDEQSIINKAVAQSQASIIPQIPGIATPIILANVNPVKSLAENGIEQARQALERAYAAKSVAEAAERTSQSALSKAADALAKYGALAASIAAIIASIATLQILGGRIDAIERGLVQLGEEVGGVLGRLLGIKNTAERAEQKAEQANNRLLIPGPQGIPGKDGKPGERGLQGIPGKDGKPGERGLQGIPGKDGKPGERGLQGIPGKDGKPGERGLQGIPGKDGKPGERGLQGIPGQQGLQGIPGQQGLQGIPGRDGKPGERGLQGIPGPQGLQGIAGKDGKDGKFNVAELASINSQLGNINAQLGNINAGVIANGQNIKRVPVEIIQDNRRLATDVIPSKVQDAFCQELNNGKCFNVAMDSWLNNQPLAKVPQQIQNLQPIVPAVQRLTPVVVNTGNIVNTTNNNITKLGNTINNTNNQITHVGGQVNNVNNQITNIGSQVNNVSNKVTNVNNQVNNITNQVTNVNNQVNNATNQITNVNNQVNNATNQITNVNNQVTNLTNQVTNVNNQVTNLTNQVTNVNNQVNNATNQITNVSNQVNNVTNQVTNVNNQVNNVSNQITEVNTQVNNIGDCDCPECVLTLPERYQIPIDGHIPQIVYVFREIKEDGTWGERMYPMTVPHPKNITPPSQRPLPDYRKGSWELMLTLKDNTKVFVNAYSMEECGQVIDAAKPLINDDFLESSFQKIGQRKGQSLLELKVRIFKVDFYEKGSKNAKPTWSKYFRN